MRSIPEDNLAYPVLIKFDGTSTGSGFNFRKDKFLYLVTAKHVLVNENNDLHGNEGSLVAYSPDSEDETPTVLKLNFENLMANENIKLHSTRDVAVIKIGEAEMAEELEMISFNLLQNIVLESSSERGIVWAGEEEILKYEEVLVSNEVIIFGYPSSIGVPGSPQFDYDRPLIRKGIIASKYKQTNTIILDCPVYYGNSGGPVIQIEAITPVKRNYKIIGVVSQFVPYVEKWVNTKNGLTNTTFLNSGYSVAESIDNVLELID